MLGKILRLAVQPGAVVEEDETVLVMEAMKMEIDVVAPAKGRLVEFKVQPGASVDAGAVLAILEPA